MCKDGNYVSEDLGASLEEDFERLSEEKDIDGLYDLREECMEIINADNDSDGGRQYTK